MSSRPEPLSATVRRLGASLLGMGRVRLELLAIEVQEEVARVAGLLFWSVLSALMLGFGLVFAALLCTVLWWDTGPRWLPLAVAALAFLALGAVGVWRVRQWSAAPATLFTASLAELRADEHTLRGGASAPAPSPVPKAGGAP